MKPILSEPRPPPMAKNKKKKLPNAHFTMRLPDDIRAKIAEKAEEMGESESLVVRQALRDYFFAAEAAHAALRREQNETGPGDAH